ncbi:MAG: hypothetical protein BHW56_03320 [Acetobacter sp. 46_36]|nr:MAG: hypothetical protein BHW56_03320 [Acetobacter sp. 46_36]
MSAGEAAVSAGETAVSAGEAAVIPELLGAVGMLVEKPRCRFGRSGAATKADKKKGCGKLHPFFRRGA